MKAAANRIRALVDQARVIEPTFDNAARLASVYRQYYRDDYELARRICTDAGSGIDGLTEPMSVEDFYSDLNQPSTLGIEIAPSGSCSEGGFIVAAYATRSVQSRRSFADYFFRRVFPRETLEFESPQCESRVLQAIEEGNVYYVGDFVGAGGPLVSSSLLIALYREIVVRRMKARRCHVLGKCLTSARIGARVSQFGNRPILVLCERMGLRREGIESKVRELRVGALDPMMPGRDAEAVLNFGLYLGDTSRLEGRIADWQIDIEDVDCRVVVPDYVSTSILRALDDGGN